MNCRDFEELLSAYADGELSRMQREFVEEHLSGCACCRETLAQFKAAGYRLSLLRDAPESPYIRRTTMSKIKAGKTLTEKTNRGWLCPAAAAAAIVAVIAIMLAAQPWNVKSPEVLAASIVRNSTGVLAALDGEEIADVKVTTTVVDGDGNVLMTLVRTEERAIAARVDIGTRQVTEIVRVDVPDFQPGDEKKAVDIAMADTRVRDLLAQGGAIGEVHLGYSIDIAQVTGPDGVTRKEGTVIPTALLTVELDEKNWNIVVNPHEGQVLSIGQSQPSAAMILVHIHKFASTVIVPVLLILGILILLGQVYNSRASRAAAGISSLGLGIVSLFIEAYGMSSIWWRMVTIVALPAVGLLIGITDLRQRTARRWIPAGGIVLCTLALAYDLFHAIIVPGGSTGAITGIAAVIAGIIVYAFKGRIMALKLSGKWLRPALAASAAVIVLALALVQPWSVNQRSVIARTCEATQGLISYRASSSFSRTAEGKTFKQYSQWEFSAPDRWRQTLTLDSREYEIIVIGDDIYISEDTDGRLTVGSWSPSIPGKEETLEVLASLTELQRLSNEPIEGSDCFHYRGKVDTVLMAEKIKSGLDPDDARDEEALKRIEEMCSISTTVELWIDKDSYLIRKWQEQTEAEGIKANSTRTYYDFNHPITIVPPLTAEGRLLPGWRLQDAVPLPQSSGNPPLPTSTPPGEEEIAPYLEARQEADFPIRMPRHIPDSMYLENVDVMDTPAGDKVARFLYGKKSPSPYIRLSQSKSDPEEKLLRDSALNKSGFKEITIQGVTGYWRQGILCRTDTDDPSTEYWDTEQIEVRWDIDGTSCTITAKSVALEELLYFANSMFKID